MKFVLWTLVLCGLIVVSGCMSILTPTVSHVDTEVKPVAFVFEAPESDPEPEPGPPQEIAKPPAEPEPVFAQVSQLDAQALEIKRLEEEVSRLDTRVKQFEDWAKEIKAYVDEHACKCPPRQTSAPVVRSGPAWEYYGDGSLADHVWSKHRSYVQSQGYDLATLKSMTQAELKALHSNAHNQSQTVTRQTVTPVRVYSSPTSGCPNGQCPTNRYSVPRSRFFFR